MIRRGQCQLPALVASVLLAPAIALANENSFEYSVEAGYQFDDNVNLSDEEPIEISGFQVAIPATLATVSERFEASLAAELISSRFNEDAYDSDDQSLDGRVKYLFENSELEAYAGYKRDSTRTSEFTDTGRVGLAASRRKVAVLGGKGFHMVTEKNGIIGSIDYSKVEYESGFYQDYDFFSGEFGWTNRWSEQLRLNLQGYANRYDNEGDIQVKTDSLGFEFGFDYRFSEHLETKLSSGWVWVESEYSSRLPVALEDGKSNGLLLDGTLTYTGEFSTVEVKIQSLPSPSGNGYVQYSRQLDLTYGYRLSEFTLLDFGLLFGQTDAVDERIDGSRDYARARLGLDYHFSQSWYLSASYIYSYQEQAFELGDAGANAVYLSLVFKPTKSVWSR